MKKPNVDNESLVIKNPIYMKSNKSIYIAFDKCFEQGNKNLNQFIITKSAYNKRADEICRYANVFLKYYDKENEFLAGLLSIKYKIDNKTSLYSMASFKSDIAEYLLTDNVIEEIFEMVEDYYSIDLTPTDDIKNINLYSLQFNNEHGKIIMALSVAYKLTIPIVCHYYSMKAPEINNFKKMKDIIEGDSNPGASYTFKEYLYDIFKSYIYLFQKDCDIYNKLYITIENHVNQTINSEKLMWDRLLNEKETPTTFAKRLMAATIVDLIPKALFNKNIVFLIQIAIPNQLKLILRGKDKYEYCNITKTAKGDELSGLEKMEANNARVSDLDIVISGMTIKQGIKNIAKKYNVNISKKEVEYYRDNLRTYAFSELIIQFFANDFGGTYDLRNISKKDYIKLLIVFKKVMKRAGFLYIHQIMTGNISNTVKRRRASMKQMNKIKESAKFKKAMKKYSMSLNSDESNVILNNIAALVNTPVEYVDYKHPENLNEYIKADIELVTMEYLKFINMI